MPSTSEITAAGVWVAAIGFLGLLLRLVGPWRKQISDAEERLRKELSEQIKEEREIHGKELDRERFDRAAEARAHALERDDLGDRIARLERMLDRQQVKHNAERALDRHRLNNINACFDALLLLLKANPGKASEAITLIEDMRAKQILAEAEEKAIIRAAEIAANDLEEGAANERA